MTDRYSKSVGELNGMSKQEFEELFRDVLKTNDQDVMENQLLYYKPVSEKAESVHFSKADIVGIGGGNGSSKTETSVVEMIMCATGIFPEDLKERLGEKLIREKCQGPMKCRIIVKSLKNQLDTIMLNKMKWWKWTGLLPEGGDKGHWGWVPRTALIDGSWDKSWIAGKYMLEFHCRDPYTEEVIGTSWIQFMSSDQEALAMAGNDLQMVIMDEPSTLAIWRENQARVMRGRGRIFLPMTWPDDPSIPVDWIFDEIYDKADKDDDIDWIELSTFDNPHLDMESVSKGAKRVSKELRQIRYEGKPMRFSNLIHPLFTDVDAHWCFECQGEESVLMTDPPICAKCRSLHIVTYNHVKDFEVQIGWPSVFLIDPHPRKPHMWSWVMVDPNDDLWQIQEGELPLEPCDVAEAVFEMEEKMGLNIAMRLMDPNMGATVSGTRRDITWQDEFSSCGLACELADDGAVGRSGVNERLRPDIDTYAPRLHIHERCKNTIYQMKRYAWDEHRLTAEKDVKQVPKPKYDDFPTLLKYLMNSKPIFRSLSPDGSPVIHTRISKKKVRR
jgi:hypothetical protein